MSRWLSSVALLVCSTLANGQEDYTVQAMAQVRDFEVARFFPDSVRESRGEHLFDVTIRYADPDEAPPQGAASRKVSYRARCDSNTLSVSLIVLRNVKGQTIKMITVPPGAEEYVKPPPGSREDDWLYRVCG